MNEKNAKPIPEWLKKSVIYQINLRCFTPEGTLKSAERLLPHLKETGVDIVYLCPFVLSDDDMDEAGWSTRQLRSGAKNPKNSYRIADYFTVDPEYGCDEDVESFVKTAHALGMKVMFDLVYMHCGPNAVFIGEHPDFVRHNPDGSVMLTKYHFPVINFGSEGLREYLYDNMTYFVRRFDVDGYRCDVGDACPLDFWEEGSRRVRALKPDFIMLNEGRKPEFVESCFDLNYGLDWANTLAKIFRKNKNATDLHAIYDANKDILPVGARELRGYENHDIANDAYEARPDRIYGKAAGEAAMVLNFTVDGVPFLYNGNEIGDNKRNNFFANRFSLGNAGIDWSEILLESGKDRLEKTKKLIELRHSSKTLCEGATTWLRNDAEEAVVSFERSLDGESYVTVVNLTDGPVKVRVEKDLSGYGTVMESGVMCLQSDISLERFGYAVIKKQVRTKVP